ncbi:hypothetical protein [Paenibacillus sp. FSL K6-1230]|uniref:hypothetical protein n=1 Tax=Paenibacillus sp. FSL K6-1230 TaxID=2921603 RepID=UPI0003A119D5
MIRLSDSDVPFLANITDECLRYMPGAFLILISALLKKSGETAESRRQEKKP